MGLNEELVRHHPVVGTADVLGDLWLSRGLDLKAFDAGDKQTLRLANLLAEVLDGWLNLWDPTVNDYRTSGVGLKSAFQTWLVADLGRLAAFDLPLEFLGQEYRFLDGSRADVWSPPPSCFGTAISRHSNSHRRGLPGVI